MLVSGPLICSSLRRATHSHGHYQCLQLLFPPVSQSPAPQALTSSPKYQLVADYSCPLAPSGPLTYCPHSLYDVA